MTIDGIITAMVTPFAADGSFSDEGIEKLIEKLVAGGVQGLFILGTNGEFYGLSPDEKLAYAKLVVEKTAGRLPVYAGTGAVTTREVIDLSRRMADAGVAAVSVIAPYFLSLTQEELYEHYKAIAQAVDLPIILYNIPKNSGNNLEAETVGRLAKIPNIIAVKDSSGDLKQLKRYIELTDHEDFSVLVGSDSKILAALKLGAKGAVAATSNLLTKTDAGIYQSFVAGCQAEAQELQNSIEAFRKVLKLATVPAVLKFSLNQIGIPVGQPLAPVRSRLTDHQKDTINQVLAAYQEYEGFTR
ncbi:4-hydroxy-tetrahydrodipicolinate synthase [Streptococcus pantholopis]|uniref:4-hydroxy-tetrahydrodipicolinate synthase n=1 Tax=Streptococcus pantholopis TaxID=1811193 RepID=A0A172Q904_9STRE|nr:4-hydroxy-tetrahydrodipicolinate synthase [Streptococcus pantholopis]AND79983.1 dihydrodipicolinate synthase family protein [Streptococcus pantholopis]